MKILISVDGVLRNKIEKFKYQFYKEMLSKETDFEYKIIDKENIQNDDLLKYFVFESKDEFEYFYFFEFALEIFGYSSISYQNCFNDLNDFFIKHKEHEVTVIGLDEYGKSKPGTLFFLSKCGFMGNNIKFITSEKIKETWDLYDIWLTDNKSIIDMCPENKKVIKFNTDYNSYFTSDNEIIKINELENYV